MAGTYWAPSEESVLLLLAERMSVSEISMELGRSYASVRTKLDRLGVQAIDGRYRYTEDQVALFTTLVEGGESVRVAAAEAHIELSTAANIARRVRQNALQKSQ